MVVYRGLENADQTALFLPLDADDKLFEDNIATCELRFGAPGYNGGGVFRSNADSLIILQLVSVASIIG